MGKGEWGPWYAEGPARQHLERMVDEQRRRACEQLRGAFVWSPAADVLELRDAIVVQVELPGVEQDRIVVEIIDGDLVVRGERPCPRLDEPEDLETDPVYRLVERVYGRFARRFRLPAGVDVARVGARLADGLLSITIPKACARTPKRFCLRID